MYISRWSESGVDALALGALIGQRCPRCADERCGCVAHLYMREL